MNVHKRIRRPLRVSIALLAAAAAIAAMLWSREQLHNLTLGSEIPLSADVYDIRPGSGKIFAVSENTFAAVSGSGWQLFDADGFLLAEDTRTLDAPAMDISGAVSVFYSVGERSLQLVYPDGHVTVMDTEEAVRFADVNEKGQLTVITDRESYKGSVTVYDHQLQPLFRWDAGSDTPVCARLSPNGQVAIGCLTENGCRFLVFRTDREMPLYEWKADHERILELAFLAEDRVAVLTDSQMAIHCPERGITGSVSTDGGYPTLFGASGQLAVLVTTPERYAGSGTAAALNSAGKNTGAYSCYREILDLSVCKNRVLLLTRGELILCSRQMEKIASLNIDRGTEYISLRPDGTALAAGSQGVELYDFGR